MKRHVIYLHGFASSAQSAKARFFRDRFRTVGIDLHCPDLNEPDFATLTISRMLDQVARILKRLPLGPVALIGSSLGAFVALQAAAAHSGEPDGHVDRLVLLAPALDFSLKNDKKIGPVALERWRTTGMLDVFHHGYGEMRRVGYALYADAQQYDPARLDLRLPILIVQGSRDDAVDPASVERFAAERPNVTLHIVNDDHQLHDSIEFIWDETVRFLGLA